uniref:ZIP family transporter n=1 Tax=Physcomitrium patens TaxID=3218 RepID=A0A7I4BEQ5_PHYPA
MMSPTCRRSGSVRARVTTGNCVERIGKIARFVTLLLIFAVWIELAAAHGGAADEATPEDGPPPNLRAKGLILVKLGSLDGEKDGAAKLDEKGRAEVNATLLHRASFGDTLLLILALCFHSVFEGIAIGVSVTKQDAWKAFWTITLHKVFAAIAMGIALLRMLPNRPLLSCFCYSFAFAISTPIGIAIGIIIDATTEGAVADWIYAIAMGLATGVFIYVAINHLLGKEYMPSKTSVEQPFKKFIALTLGAATMAIVMIWDA